MAGEDIDMKKIGDVNYYELLAVDITATESEIKRAYRKKALQCHPDKNPDDPKAAETFHKLSQALMILTELKVRTAYDKILRAKEAAKLQRLELGSKRRKLIEDLERREREAGCASGSTDAQNLAAEIERLNKEGSRLLLEEQRKMRDLIHSAKDLSQVYDSSLHRIKIKWIVDKTDELNGGYDEVTLRRFLKKYGDIVALIMSQKKGTAIVEFSTQEASEMAVDLEKGLPNNPLNLKWLAEKPKKNTSGPSLISDRDYESLVLTKMRQAAERQRVIEEMLKEENGLNKTNNHE